MNPLPREHLVQSAPGPDLQSELRRANRTIALLKGLLSTELAVKGVVKRLLRRRPAPISDFCDADYQRYIQRRLEHLATLGLPINGKKVLEVGAGIGELTSFFVDRDCTVTSTEVRQESLSVLRTRYPDITVRPLDLENPGDALAPGEVFDVVFCYGVLYHLGRPADAIAYMANRCSGLLLIETRVSLGEGETENLQYEIRDSPTQAVSGCGCRPTRRWIFNRLREHFPHVYMPLTQPWRPHFPVDWTRTPTEDVLTNAVFIASREPLANRGLVEDLPIRQLRA